MAGFTQKIKEPSLSEKMQRIIENSQNLDKKSGESYDQIIRYKYHIMKKLLSNKDLLKALHNEELEAKIADWDKADGNIYKYINIFDFLKIPGVQSEVKNYICFGVNEDETMRYKDDMMIYTILFRTVSHEDDYKTDWGISRQDLLASIIKNDFDWTNEFGMHFVKERDSEKVYENGYYYREFVYEINNPNALQNKLTNGVGLNARMF